MHLRQFSRISHSDGLDYALFQRIAINQVSPLLQLRKVIKTAKSPAEADKNNVRKTERKNTGSYHKDNRLYFYVPYSILFK